MVERATAKEYDTEPKPKKLNADEAVKAALLDAIREIETTVAGKWMAEQHNDGARAAAVVLRKKLGLGPTDPLPEKPTEAP
jgi:hypothetical protein